MAKLLEVLDLSGIYLKLRRSSTKVGGNVLMTEILFTGRFNRNSTATKTFLKRKTGLIVGLHKTGTFGVILVKDSGIL